MFYLGPIIFDITFAITAFKLCFQDKHLVKRIIEALRPKTAYLNFMVIPYLTLFCKPDISGEYKYSFLSQNADKNPCHSLFH